MSESVYSKASRGDYTTTLPYGSKPIQPDLLRKRVGDLTAKELASVATVRADYESAIEAHERARYLRNEDQGRLHMQFVDDLEAEFGTKGHPKAAKLFQIAWEYGHASGYAEVAGQYGELSELVI